MWTLRAPPGCSDSVGSQQPLPGNVSLVAEASVEGAPAGSASGSTTVGTFAGTASDAATPEALTATVTVPTAPGPHTGAPTGKDPALLNLISGVAALLRHRGVVTVRGPCPAGATEQEISRRWVTPGGWGDWAWVSCALPESWRVKTRTCCGGGVCGDIAILSDFDRSTPTPAQPAAVEASSAEVSVGNAAEERTPERAKVARLVSRRLPAALLACCMETAARAAKPSSGDAAASPCGCGSAAAEVCCRPSRASA